jgi:hypothetical protein
MNANPIDQSLLFLPSKNKLFYKINRTGVQIYFQLFSKKCPINNKENA